MIQLFNDTISSHTGDGKFFIQSDTKIDRNAFHTDRDGPIQPSGHFQG